MKQSGMTLLELIVVVAVSAILLGVGVPSFASLVQSGRVTSATNAMVASLHLARSEAIKRQARTVLCPSAGAACAGTGDWHQGWVVFHDVTNNGLLDAGDPIISRQPAIGPGLTLTGNQNVSRYISYTPTGSAKLVSGAWQFGTLTLCTNSGAAREIVISSTGRVRTAKLKGCL
jgi:type IV fimbrial biogenesis protein FimT